MKKNKKALISIIGIPTPPGLAHTIGYSGPGKYLGVWWEHCSDDLCLSDGRTTSCGMGHWQAWKIYSEHPSVLPYLDSYFFGTPEAPATHALVIDLVKNRIMVGAQSNVISFLQENAPALNDHQQKAFEKFITGPDPTTGKMGFDVEGFNASFMGKIFENTDALIASMLETHKKETGRFSELQAWLDKQKTFFFGNRNQL